MSVSREGGGVDHMVRRWFLSYQGYNSIIYCDLESNLGVTDTVALELNSACQH